MMHEVWVDQHDFAASRPAILHTQTVANLTKHAYQETLEVQEAMDWQSGQVPTPTQAARTVDELADVVLFTTSAVLGLHHYGIIDRINHIVDGTHDEGQLQGTPHQLADQLIYHAGTLAQWGRDGQVDMTTDIVADRIALVYNLTSTIARQIGCEDFSQAIATKLAANHHRFTPSDFQILPGETPFVAFTRAYTAMKVGRGERPAGWSYQSS